MKGVVRRRRAARTDLITIYRHYAREAGLRVADRFHAKAEATLRRLASRPGLGKRYTDDNPVLAELRYLPISAPFKAYIVFYRPTDVGIEVVRVLHGARDIARLLADEFGIDVDSTTEKENDGPS